MKNFLFFILIVMVGCAETKHDANANAMIPENPKIYERATLPFRRNLPDMILQRMREPYITAGEDVELLDQEFDSWLKSMNDVELSKTFDAMEREKLAAIYQFIDPIKLKSHPGSLKLMIRKCSDYPLFPAKLADQEDGMNN